MPFVVINLVDVALVIVSSVIFPVVPQNVGRVAYVVEALVMVPFVDVKFVIVPFVDQRFVKVA